MSFFNLSFITNFPRRALIRKKEINHAWYLKSVELKPFTLVVKDSMMKAIFRFHGTFLIVFIFNFNLLHLDYFEQIL